MKKIVLTLGIFLSAYAMYAAGNSNQVYVDEDDNCVRINRFYDNHGNVIHVSYEPC